MKSYSFLIHNLQSPGFRTIFWINGLLPYNTIRPRTVGGTRVIQQLDLMKEANCPECCADAAVAVVLLTSKKATLDVL